MANQSEDNSYILPARLCSVWESTLPFVNSRADWNISKRFLLTRPDFYPILTHGDGHQVTTVNKTVILSSIHEVFSIKSFLILYLE